MKSRIKRLCALVVLFSVIFVTTPYRALATQATKDKLDDAKQNVKEAEQAVKDAKDDVDKIEKRKNTLKKELSNLNALLEELVEKIEELEDKVTTKENEIEETQKALEEAKNTEENQYESMKKRIQFMYEDSETLYLEIMFQAKSFSQFLTLSNYVDSLAQYDRKKFEEYKDTRIQIEELESKLMDEKHELDLLKADADAEKVQLSVTIANTQGTFSEYSDLLEDAEKELLEYEADLKEKNETYASIKKQYEEEIRLSQLAAKSAWRDISEVTFEEGDRYLLAVLIYCEAGGEPYEGQVAVGAVVINRLLSSVYPNTLSGVIYQKSQFSPVSSGRFAYYLSIGKTTQSCYNAADAAMSGVTNVGNSLHFRTPIPGLTGTQIGNHIFY